jgi:uncharacterized SAM-binding protein YcdF (DUF218 family)
MSFVLPFALKRFIAQFLMPIPLVIEVFILGWVLARFTRFRRTGTVFKVLAGCLFLKFGYGWGEVYLGYSELRYPPFEPSISESEKLRGADVLVLGQKFRGGPELPVRFWANSTMMLRLQEGMIDAKRIPDSRLIVSMPGETADLEKKKFLDEFAMSFEFPRSRLAIIPNAQDTSDEARFALRLSGTNRLVLVTSAAHMPRAMSIFGKRGVTPIPAPCDYHFVSDNKRMRWSHLALPSGNGFQCSESALYEWLGSLYERMSD